MTTLNKATKALNKTLKAQNAGIDAALNAVAVKAAQKVTDFAELQQALLTATTSAEMQALTLAFNAKYPVAVVAKKASVKTAKSDIDLTKRDVVAVFSKSLNLAYICTSVKYSARANAADLLKADMLKRASLVTLANAADFEFVILAAQENAVDAQNAKYAQHLKAVQTGYTMLSTKGKNITVVVDATA